MQKASDGERLRHRLLRRYRPRRRALRRRLPVVGIGEAAFHMASLIAGKFSVVTTLSRSVPAIEHNLVRYGLASRCARVRASDVPVLELEDAGLRRPRTHLGGDRARHRATTAPKRSCSAAPAWRTSPQRSAASTACRCSTASPARSGLAKASSDSALRPPSEADTRRRAKNPSPEYSRPFRPAAASVDAVSPRQHIGESSPRQRECSRMLAKLLTFHIRKVDVPALAEARCLR